MIFSQMGRSCSESGGKEARSRRPHLNVMSVIRSRRDSRGSSWVTFHCLFVSHEIAALKITGAERGGTDELTKRDGGTTQQILNHYKLEFIQCFNHLL